MNAMSIRVDATRLQQFQGKVVRVMGRCELFNTNDMRGKLESNGPIPIKSPSQILEAGKNYEIIGRIGSGDDLTVQVYTMTELSDDFNLEVAKKLVDFVHKVPELFYTT
ncbi:uncharacterized protein KQ657_002915 [Scheffersomyces spartinae]|uniref:Replication factor A protein 3 n=1 Tax=Scheffersomyces spartinae TaxID=45513 RepID=A0A9P7V5B3_9ASCO|nr:uncharacterized protein KQ657_002915 [Scheffersomyces spartinae]KAG7191646.1 hypothetical protein KQ657_002915 [Scheffersomyces spartinae]